MNTIINNLLLSLISFFYCQGALYAQEKAFPIYYSPVKMPAALKTNYYSQFDTELLASDLAMLLQRATGKPYKAIPYKSGAARGIFLILDSLSTFSGNESGLVESDGKNFVRITARYTTGVSYAMYSWLEQLGFHFYLPGEEWTIIPSLQSIYKTGMFRKLYEPHFRLRMFNASGGIFPVKGLDDSSQNEKDWQKWYLRNRMGCDYIGIDGHIGELFNIVHKKEIEADPTILAPINGKRIYSEEGKLDPTNPKAVSLFANWILKEFKVAQAQSPSFLPFKKYYTVDAGDGLNYCHTPDCNRQFKSVSDQVFSIANEAARKIKMADPLAGVSTLAYTERADTPSINIEPNVHVMVVPTGFQSVSTPTELMQRWARKSKNISQYDFLNIGVWAYDAPFFNLYSYHQNLLFLKELKIEGMNFETSLSKFSSGIQQYFILKFLCEPYLSVDKLLDEFCKNNFGKAAPPVKKLFREWYFSDTHINTGRDKGSFNDDELGRFVKYASEAEILAGSIPAIQQRIGELKAYIVYLCKFNELFNDLHNQELFAVNPSLKIQKTEELLTYTWQLYPGKIFHNTQLNDMLKKGLGEGLAASWDFRTSNKFKGITQNIANIVQTQFAMVKHKYLPLATAVRPVTAAFLAAHARYSADSIRVSTIDETAFGNYLYPIPFYCAGPGMLIIAYQADSNSNSNSQDKIAIIAVESANYRFIQTDFIFREKSNGLLHYNIPAKGYYKLYLSQYQATHMSYVIYPGRNLFYLNKMAIPMNGILLQDNNTNSHYPNRYLAFLSPGTDSLLFNNYYWNSTNTIQLYSKAGIPILVDSKRQPFQNVAALKKEERNDLVFYTNSVFRWPMVLKNTAPFYFFLNYPAR